MPQLEPHVSPLVLTLALETRAQASFDAMRERYFPPGRNLVPAHLTLFHALPGLEETGILQTLRRLGGEPEMRLEVVSLMKLGRGVAFRIASDPLLALHATLQRLWWPWLTAQDRQGFRPHIVVQNKVEASDACALYAELAAGFQPFSCTAEGLVLWRYLGGPWSWIETIRFIG